VSRNPTRRQFHGFLADASPAGKAGLLQALNIKPTEAKQRPDKIWRQMGYDSAWEMEYAGVLRSRQMAGEVREYQHHPPKIELAPARDGQRALTYTPDFRVVLADGQLEYHEVKGFRRRAGVMSFKLAADLMPEARWLMVSKHRSLWTTVMEYKPKETP